MNLLDSSYTQLIEATGIQRTLWSDYFNRKTWPTVKTLLKIAKALDMDVKDVLDQYLTRCERVLEERIARERKAAGLD